MRANASVLGMRDGQEYRVADSGFIRNVIATGKLTLLADPSFVSEDGSGPEPDNAADPGQQAAPEAPASSGKAGKK